MQILLAVIAAGHLVLSGPKAQKTFTLADLESMPRTKVSVSDHGSPATFEGVALYPLLETVGAPAGDHLRGKDLDRYVLVEARDGYRVVFSLGELNPSFTDRKVIVAWQRDGKPLGQDAAPFQIVVEGDKRMGRSARQVTTIRILQSK